MKRCDFCLGEISPGDEVSAPDLIGVMHYSRISCAEVLRSKLETATIAGRMVEQQRDEAIRKGKDVYEAGLKFSEEIHKESERQRKRAESAELQLSDFRKALDFILTDAEGPDSMYNTAEAVIAKYPVIGKRPAEPSKDNPWTPNKTL